MHQQRPLACRESGQRQGCNRELFSNADKLEAGQTADTGSFPELFALQSLSSGHAFLCTEPMCVLAAEDYKLASMTQIKWWV